MPLTLFQEHILSIIIASGPAGVNRPWTSALGTMEKAGYIIGGVAPESLLDCNWIATDKGIQSI